MSRPATQPVKAARRFAPPPWDRSSPQWQDIDGRLPEDHPARLIDQAVDHLDLFAFSTPTLAPAPWRIGPT